MYTGRMRTNRRTSVPDGDLAALLEEAKRVVRLDPEWTQHGPCHWLQVEKNAIMLWERTPRL